MQTFCQCSLFVLTVLCLLIIYDYFAPIHLKYRENCAINYIYDLPILRVRRRLLNDNPLRRSFVRVSRARWFIINLWNSRRMHKIYDDRGAIAICELCEAQISTQNNLVRFARKLSVRSLFNASVNSRLMCISMRSDTQEVRECSSFNHEFVQC